MILKKDDVEVTSYGKNCDIRGFIDLMFYDDFTESVYIIDHKSGKFNENQDKLQISIYYLVAYKLFQNAEIFNLNFDFIEHDKSVSYTYTRDDFQKVLNYVKDELNIDDAKHFSKILHNQMREINKIVIGQESVVERVIIALMCDGHALLEGVPGLAKTLTIKTLAKVLRLDFKRIQFTPDLLPSDIVGSMVYNQKDATFWVKKGHLMCSTCLDEIEKQIKLNYFEEIEERLKLDINRQFRTGVPEVVYGKGKDVEEIIKATLKLAEKNGIALATKIEDIKKLSDEIE